MDALKPLPCRILGRGKHLSSSERWLATGRREKETARSPGACSPITRTPNDTQVANFLMKSVEQIVALCGGMVGTLPTATDSDVAGRQWRLAPEFLLARFEEWGLHGIFPSHQWDVAEREDRPSYSTSSGGSW